MKIIKLQKQISEELRIFRETGKTDKQILKIELEGMEAIMFRTLLSLSKDDEKIQNIKSAIKLGCIGINNQLIEEKNV